MIPGGQLSSIPIPADIIGGRGSHISNVIDYEYGGIALNDSSMGKMYQIWEGKLVGEDIILDSPNTSPEVVFNGSEITEFSFTFDQNMKPVISFVQDKIAKYRWYDSTVPDYVVTTIPGDVITPKMFLDDKRLSQEISSDIILAYVKLALDSKDLYYRLQRDRFGVEYLLKEDIRGVLHKFGMNKKLRLQFVILKDRQ